MSRPDRILHLIPDSAAQALAKGLKPGLFAGSTKDILGRQEYFQARSLEFDVLPAPGRSDEETLRLLGGLDLRPYRAAVVELPLYPLSLAHLRSRRPDLLILVRPINAEMLHQLHGAWACLKHETGVKGKARARFKVKKSYHRLRLDHRCAQLADFVLAITPWEIQHYWSRLVDPGKVRYLPYFLPRLMAGFMPCVEQKQKLCLCLLSPSQKPNLFQLDSALNFSRLVDSLGNDLPDWEFGLTGRLERWSNAWPERIKPLGLVANPLALLARATAVALPSDLGFGFKTKLLEAALAGCALLVTLRVLRRLPDELKPACLAVDPARPESFRRALWRCRENPPQAIQANDLLKAQAFAVLDELLGV